MMSITIAAALLLTSQDGFVPIFNGKDLSGWTPKIKGHPLGENYRNTFRVKDGILQVRYDEYGGKFGDKFGHLFYKDELSHYVLQLEYRFVGEQLSDGQGWAWRNSGVMIHGQRPETMGIDQGFPVSAEAQLLGGPAEGKRPTANLCTPGTNVMMNGKLWTQHCTDSSSDTFRGDQWVKVEIEVHGAGLVVHRVNGKEVIRYDSIQYDPNDPDAKRIMPKDGLLIHRGTISLQSESHPIDFRNIRVKILKK
jgi:hypothetical protein